MAGSFWEKVGRSVGDGLQKAKDAAASIGEKGEAILDKQELRRRLRRFREELSRLVEKELRGADGPPYTLENATVKELLSDIKLATEELERLESAGEEEESGKKDASAESSGQEQTEEPE